jgi:hypothetical protein
VVSFLIWIELHGSWPDNNGWLYDGKSDLLAFETKESFVLVKRSALIELVESKVDKNKRVHNSSEALYCIYNRRGFEQLTFLSIYDIVDIM